ncbi:MAG: GNAT family N-acetyltransferase [Ardenticatenales bacterium]
MSTSDGATIATARLLLRPMTAADTDALLGIFGDPNVMAAFNEPTFERPQMERWVQRNLDHQAAHGYGLYSVVLKADGLLIGDCGLERMDDAGDRDGAVAELGYDFRSDHWNQGYATEAAIAVRDHAFGSLALPRLISLIRVGNEASRRVAEKVGMKHVETVERYGRSYWRYGIARDDARGG